MFGCRCPIGAGCGGAPTGFCWDQAALGATTAIATHTQIAAVLMTLLHSPSRSTRHADACPDYIGKELSSYYCNYSNDKQ
jgi:hypothetical protein